MGGWVKERTNLSSLAMEEKERRPRCIIPPSLGFKAYLIIAYLATAAQNAFAGKLFAECLFIKGVWLLLNPCCHGYCFGFVRPLQSAT